MRPAVKALVSFRLSDVRCVLTNNDICYFDFCSTETLFYNSNGRGNILVRVCHSIKKTIFMTALKFRAHINTYKLYSSRSRDLCDSIDFRCARLVYKIKASTIRSVIPFLVIYFSYVDRLNNCHTCKDVAT